MKILLCNKYFFLNGGTERYISDLMPQLEQTGHQAIPFSIKYAESWDSPYSAYFLDPPGDPQHTRLKHIKLTPLSGIRYLDRSIYSFEARQHLSRLLKAVGKIDMAYLLNIYNYMSPSIIHTLRRSGIPVAMQLADYNLLCPSYSFLRNGSPCTLCIHGDYFYGFRFHCVKKNYLASAVRTAGMYIQKWLRIYSLIDAFIVPCNFMKTKLIEGGFPAGRIHLLRYPVVKQFESASITRRKNYILYFGRISFEKGLDTLIRAYQRLSSPPDLLLAGRDYDGEKERLKKNIRPEYLPHIKFLGFKNGPALSQLISEARLSVVPSRWYDNAPISIYESFLYKTPVVAADIGGIPEQIHNGVNGKLFVPDSVKDLTGAFQWMLADPARLETMGQAGYDFVTRELSIQKHARSLISLFQGLIHCHPN